MSPKSDALYLSRDTSSAVGDFRQLPITFPVLQPLTWVQKHLTTCPERKNRSNGCPEIRKDPTEAETGTEASSWSFFCWFFSGLWNKGCCCCCPPCGKLWPRKSRPTIGSKNGVRKTGLDRFRTGFGRPLKSTWGSSRKFWQTKESPTQLFFHFSGTLISISCCDRSWQFRELSPFNSGSYCS